MNKEQHCYMSVENGRKDAGVEELKRIGFDDFTNKDHRLIQLDTMKKFGDLRVVYSTTHTKCREILKSGLEMELEDIKSNLNGL